MSPRKPTRRAAVPPAHRGFTLIEITVVLVIMALLLAGGLALTTSLIDAQRVRTTKQNLDAVRDAIQAFVARNGRLPCPAVETLAPTDANYGLEANPGGSPPCTSTTDLGSGSPTPGARGVVPWKSLGMQAEVALDGWSNQVTYAVTRAAARNTTTSANVMGIRGVLTVHSAVPVALGLPATGNQLNACSTTAGDNTCNAAAVAVLISHGRNVQGAFNPSGARAPVPGSNLEVENTDTSTAFVLTDPVTGSANSFDDIVVALSPTDVLGKLYQQGVIPSEQALIQARFREVVQMLAADAVRNRIGSTPGDREYPFASPSGTVAYSYASYASYFNSNCQLGNPPSTVGTLPTNMQVIRDPWGNSFRFTVAEAYDGVNPGLDATQACPTPVVVVSLGADGALGTADDVRYFVPLGDFQAVFSSTGW